MCTVSTIFQRYGALGCWYCPKTGFSWSILYVVSTVSRVTLYSLPCNALLQWRRGLWTPPLSASCPKGSECSHNEIHQKTDAPVSRFVFLQPIRRVVSDWCVCGNAASSYERDTDTSDVPYEAAVHCRPQPVLRVSLVTPIIVHNLEKERETLFCERKSK